ncbi:sulfotransferase family protein [Nocardioides sambongensis]|uniref:hypothetical protein n=1 Tax=Nocardioides sambongensis TaxID=2589074 RepID=UPI00112DD13D|nr:hypothetical protein [Nocardioides sambongensis]
MGMPRGGTSLVGGLVRLCGLPFGEGMIGNHEDPAFNFDYIRRAGGDPLTEIRRAIPERNAAYDAWGWKYPRATRYLDDIRNELRSPHLIVVLRDPVAAAGRHRGGEGGRRAAVLRQHDLQMRNLDLIERWQVPTLAVSYERGISQPVRLARQIARFLGFPVPERSRVLDFVTPGRYQMIDGDAGGQVTGA